MFPTRRIATVAGAAVMASLVAAAGFAVSPDARTEVVAVAGEASDAAGAVRDFVTPGPDVVDAPGPEVTLPAPQPSPAPEPSDAPIPQPKPAPITSITEEPAPALPSGWATEPVEVDGTLVIPIDPVPQPEPEPEPVPVEVMPVEPLPFVAYECDVLDNQGNPTGERHVIGIGAWIGDDLTGQDPWAPVRNDPSCVGLPDYPTPGL